MDQQIDEVQLWANAHSEIGVEDKFDGFTSRNIALSMALLTDAQSSCVLSRARRATLNALPHVTSHMQVM